MHAYEHWNYALASRFFNPGMEGRNVYLYINQETINEIEQEIGQEAGIFRVAVAGQPGVLGKEPENICSRALQVFTNWRASGSTFPPYIGYLSFFVLASSIDGDFAPHAYHPRLWKLLTGESREGSVPKFDRMRQLWDDLEQWAIVDKQARLGNFQSRPIGGNVHIGYPLSQAILVEQDRRVLPRIFRNTRLDPTTTYPKEELARALLTSFARQLLKRRTNQLIANSDYKELRATILEVVAEELANWDGSISEPDLEHDGPTSIFAGLRLGIELDQVAGTAKSTVRFKLNREFPEDGLVLDTFLVEEDVNGWSLPIKNYDSGKIFDSSSLDWYNGETINSTSTGWSLNLPGREVRIFISGINEGISGLVETNTLPRHLPFYLAYTEASWPRLERWATTQCKEFNKIEIIQGLPESWRLASVAKAIEDEAVREEFPILSFPSEVRLCLVGGIRSGSGNNFFSFAPPSVVLQGQMPGAVVRCNDMPMESGENEEVYLLADNLPTETRIALEARAGQSVLDRQSLFLTGDFGLSFGEPKLLLDSTGNFVPPEYDGPYIAGAYIKGQFPELGVSAAELFEDLEQKMGGIQGFLIGQQPGQVVTWPSEPFPSGWVPEWAIQRGRGRKKKWKVILVGKILGTFPTNSTTLSPTRQEVQMWKRVLWYFRKRIKPPESPIERTRWKQIQKAAKDV